MNVPKLRFKEFTGEWERKTLREVVCSLDYGMGASACEYDGINKYIRITDIDDVTHKYLDSDMVSPNGELCDKYVVRPNDILFARTGASTGKTYLYSEKDGLLYFAGFLIRANVKREYDANFIYSQTLLNRYIKWVGIESMRSGQPGINAAQYSKFTVNVPVYEEQKKISAMLGMVDDKISNCYKIITSLEKQKKALMKKIFSQELQFKDDDGKEFPVWKEKKLGEVVLSISSGKNKYRDDFGKFSVYGSTGKIGYTNEVEYSGEMLLVARVGANAGLLNYIDEECGVSDNTLVVKIKEEYNTKYFFYALQEYNLNKLTFGSGQPLVNSSMIKKILFFIPNRCEQNKITDFFGLLDEKIEKEKVRLEHWQRIKKGLLQQMLV